MLRPVGLISYRPINIPWSHIIKIVPAEGSSAVKDIVYGQRYNLADWSTSTVTDDPSVPKNGFIFSGSIIATPIICLKQVDVGNTSTSIPGAYSDGVCRLIDQVT